MELHMVGGVEDLGGNDSGETSIRIYCMKR